MHGSQKVFCMGLIKESFTDMPISQGACRLRHAGWQRCGAGGGSYVPLPVTWGLILATFMAFDVRGSNLLR